ncbi:MAG: metal ABC transporter permease [Odoribacter sp.]
MSYLFGNILTVTRDQIIMSVVLCLLIILFFIRFYRPLFYIAFDKEYSKTHHVHVNIIDVAITLIIALCFVLCLKLAGIILVISYLTIPQAIVSLFYKNFKQLLVASAIISTIGSMPVLFVAAELNTPTGATIVICFLIFFVICW